MSTAHSTSMWQFSTRTLFILTAAVAGLAWVFFAPPQWVGLMVLWLLYWLLPAAALAGIVYHRGAWQAFFIGTAPWAVGVAIFLWIWAIDDGWRLVRDGLQLIDEGTEELIQIKLMLGFPLFMAACSGALTVAIWAWAAGVRQRQPRS
ncbi:MAG TPA: hypothetical protein VFB80_17735 [Pirellulaceae bacterium]|nr:hypothetical protein [Pirellulaceae bacterium]